MPAIKIIALDDHQLYLEGIRTALAREPDMHLAGAGRAAADLQPLLKTHYPDIALIDLHIPGFDGPRSIRRCVERYPKTRFVALTGSRDEALVRRVAQSGGSGYLLKESILGDRFADLLRRIHAGTGVAGIKLLEGLDRHDSRKRRAECALVARDDSQ